MEAVAAESSMEAGDGKATMPLGATVVPGHYGGTVSQLRSSCWFLSFFSILCADCSAVRRRRPDMSLDVHDVGQPRMGRHVDGEPRYSRDEDRCSGLVLSRPSETMPALSWPH